MSQDRQQRECVLSNICHRERDDDGDGHCGNNGDEETGMVMMITMVVMKVMATTKIKW